MSVVQMEIPDGGPQLGVKNDGMSSDQQNQSHQQKAGADRPASARSNRERQERIVLLKERQNHERIKKLEELKEHAAAAARLRDEQDSRRRKHFEELGKKEEERRKQAEERRRMLDEERKIVLQTKWETKKGTPAPISNAKCNKPTFAFGSCTPRLIDNHVDGFLWKSQYNLNVTKEPGLRASSAQDLHLQQNEVRMSTSMYEWNQQRTTIDNPLVQQPAKRLLDKIKNDGADMSRIFCGRRKTDLTPTLPIRRDNYDTSMMSRSTSRGSGRVYSSMTRLDRSRSPGGGHLSLTQHQHHPQQRPSRSKSTTHLSSAGLKLTRTEVLRQALAAKKDLGMRSGDPSRPPSSLSSLMTSSTHSQVQMRPRTMTRKSRPASVHVTGISNDNLNGENNNKTHHLLQPKRADTPQGMKQTPPSGTVKKYEPRKRLEMSKPPPNPAATGQQVETSTIKRAQKKKPSSSNKDKSATEGLASGATTVSSDIKEIESRNEEQGKNLNPVPTTSTVVEAKSDYLETGEILIPLDKAKDNGLADLVLEGNKDIVLNTLTNKVENFESIESAFASDDFTDSSKTPEPIGEQKPDLVNLLDSKQIEAIPTAVSSVADQFNPFVNPVPLLLAADPKPNPPVHVESKVGEEETTLDSSKPKILTEEEAKAALAEKRRLAREALEREAARLEEEQRLEEERQRLEAEEAERILREAKALEEERLRLAIEEQQRREADERKRKEDEEIARLEKESQDREAAREAERIRLEMEERLRREEEERLERRRRVEAIMSRTRKKEAEQQAKNNAADKTNNESINGHKDNNELLEENVQASNNSFNNNYNNNNEFSGNDSSTLISFEGMVGVGGQGINNMGGEGTGIVVGNTSTASSNPIITNSIQG